MEFASSRENPLPLLRYTARALFVGLTPPSHAYVLPYLRRFADIKRRAHDLTPRRRPSLGDVVLWALLMQRGDANLLAEPACVDSEPEESDRPGDDDQAVLAPSFDALAAALSRSLERIESTCAVMERSLNTATQRTRRSDESYESSSHKPP